MTPATQQQPEPRPGGGSIDAAKLAWARVVHNALTYLFWLGVLALILRACGRI